MTSREMHAETMRTLEGMRTKIDVVESLAKENKEQLKRITPQNTVQPVPRPKQGSQLARGASVTKYLRKYTKEKNEKIPDGMPRYEEFSEDIDDKQYNTDAMNTLEWILGLHLGNNLGVLTWEQVCKKSPGKMGLIIRDAVASAELKVFAQAAGQWAVQMLITSKMNSRIRYNRDRRVQAEAQEEEENFAPMSVPDLIPDENLPEDSHSIADARLQEEYHETDYVNQDTYHPLNSQQIHPGQSSSFIPDSTNDEGIARHSNRRAVQHRRASQFDTGTPVASNILSQGIGVAIPVARNRTGTNRAVRCASSNTARGRGRGTRTSRAGSSAGVRGISRPSRARRASAVASRRVARR